MFSALSAWIRRRSHATYTRPPAARHSTLRSFLAKNNRVGKMHHAISARAGHEVDTAPLAGYRGIDDRHGG